MTRAFVLLAPFAMLFGACGDVADLGVQTDAGSSSSSACSSSSNALPTETSRCDFTTCITLGGLPCGCGCTISTSSSGSSASSSSSSCPAGPIAGQPCAFPAGRVCPGILQCPGEGDGPLDVECMAGVWSGVSKDSCGPVRCVVGGACSVGGCSISGAGPCGSDEALQCTGGSYALQSYTCTDEGNGCTSVADGPDGCTMSCTCTNGIEACTSSGGCDAG